MSTPLSRQKSTSSPSKVATETLLNPLVPSSSISSFSSTLNRPFLLTLFSTAAMTSSYWRAARPMMSMCPLVTGSKDPEQTTRRTATALLSCGWAAGTASPGIVPRGRGGFVVTRGATVPKRRFSVSAPSRAGVPLGPRRFRAAGRALQHHQGLLGQPAAVAQPGQHGAHLLLGGGVRRVGHHQVVPAAGGPAGEHPPHPVGGQHGAGQAQRLDVAPDHRRGPA